MTVKFYSGRKKKEDSIGDIVQEGKRVPAVEVGQLRGQEFSGFYPFSRAGAICPRFLAPNSELDTWLGDALVVCISVIARGVPAINCFPLLVPQGRGCGSVLWPPTSSFHLSGFFSNFFLPCLSCTRSF